MYYMAIRTKTFRKTKSSRRSQATTVSSLSRKVTELAREVKQNAPEKNYEHDTFSITTQTELPVITTPSTVSQREHVSKHLTVRMKIQDSTTTANAFTNYCRMVVVWDKAPDDEIATPPAFAYINSDTTDANRELGQRSPFVNYGTGTNDAILSIRNPNTYSRFKILFDKTYTTHFLKDAIFSSDRINIDMKTIEQLNPATTVLNTIESGQLLVYFIQSGSNTNVVDIDGSYTYCWTDCD